MPLTIVPEPLSPRPLRGLGVQADCCIYDDENRATGVTDEHLARWEARIRALRPAFARIFVPISDFNPSLDGETYDWDTPVMGWQRRNLAVLRDAGADVHVCMGPWTNQQMLQDGMERTAVDLAERLRGEGFPVRWLSLYNEPEGFYAQDTALYRQLFAGRTGQRPWSDYVAKHQRTQALLAERGLAEAMRLVVPDCVMGSRLRQYLLERAARDFADLPVAYSFHRYASTAPGYYDHPDSQPFAAFPGEFAGYRRAVGDAAELICWEFNHAGYGMGVGWTGTGPRGEDLLGTVHQGAMVASQVLEALCEGVDGLCFWCVGDSLYRGGMKFGPMTCGLWRGKWEAFVPRPVFYYYAALTETFRRGARLHAVGGLPEGWRGLVAETGGERRLVLLNPLAEAGSVELPAGPRLRVCSDTLPQRPDALARPCPAGEVPLADWAPHTGRATLAPHELTIVKLAG